MESAQVKNHTRSKTIIILAVAAILLLAGAVYLSYTPYAGYLDFSNSNTFDNPVDQSPGMEIVLGNGESATNGGVTIKVNNIGATSVSVTNGADTKIIGKGETYSFSNVKVEVKSIIYTDTREDRKVTLLISPIEK
jgi:hypothetical protein